jgi:tetratricopeptide (TPR) repeat protein
MSLILIPVNAAAEDEPDGFLQLFLPNYSQWHMTMELPGFEIPSYEFTEDGEELFVEALKPSDNMIVSVYVGPKLRPEGAIGCRNYYKMKNFLNKDYKEVNIRDWQYKEITISEHELRDFEGSGDMVKNYHGCVVRGDRWISISISKLGYIRGDRTEFIDVLKTIQILNGPPWEYVEFMAENVLAEENREPWMEVFLGLYYYEQGDYENAIKHYSEAYKTNLETMELEELMWLDVINALGVSYGITKDYENAFKVFEYGIEYSPEFGIFYYNLACTYAETGDKTKALENLKIALKYKVNPNNGRELPDPLTDISFESLWDDPDFLELAKQFN